MAPNSTVNFTTLLETELVGPPNAEKSHTRSQSQRVGEPTTHPPPHPPFPPETFFFFKYNKSLKDPVRGAGFAQV